MKTLKINSKQTLLTISIIVLLLTNIFAQSGNNVQSDACTNTESVVAKPKLDIYTAVLSGLYELVKQHIEGQSYIEETKP
ncbi:hypothetical protein SAMN06265379_10114 [Saccharicrinis carchari]|uniref:Uncharacterized protein n=1 Tax=Saccharicrinis carchari TaxID=1168039 RepID=A0A521ABX0_SACCC|nr:hypothetical protein [Saccharicrinis carchari]SMO32251.1 hypothetical protein SAMN06265379_10114 [Saccharicrinis carchari]